MSRRSLGRFRWLVLALALAALAAPAVAQTDPQPASTSGTAASRDTGPAGRLFLGFEREAVLVNRQWWEGQIEIAQGDVIDVQQARLVVAMNPFRGMEFGGRIGFGSTDTDSGLPDGRGATDLDLWAKFALGRFEGGTHVVAGALLTLPTGDNTAGLGDDAFSGGGFLAIRRPIGRMTLHADFGIRSYQDGEILGFKQDGRTTGFVGGGLVIPMDRSFDFIAEARYESEKFRDRDADSRVLGGIDWRLTDNGRLRAAVGFGVTDGAPDFQFIAGWAGMF